MSLLLIEWKRCGEDLKTETETFANANKALLRFLGENLAAMEDASQLELVSQLYLAP